ncbi:VanZ family protein [Idiomarina seosinensis]|uniref:VanZ family protein n=1 Tax=Idiomarina seosinensis TaxID=281739 RepID=UPI00384F0B20
MKGSAKAVLWARIAFVVLLIAATGAFFWQSPPSQANQIPHLDKLVHFTVFFLLSLTLHRAFTLKARFAFVLLALYGLLIEIAQHYIPGRGSDVYDWIADSAGVLAYFVLTSFYQKLIKKR